MKKILAFLFVFLAVNMPAYSQDKKGPVYAQDNEGADFNSRDLQNNAAKGAANPSKKANPRLSKRHTITPHHDNSDPPSSPAHVIHGNRQAPSEHAKDPR